MKTVCEGADICQQKTKFLFKGFMSYLFHCFYKKAKYKVLE